ncbi:hypothetical protein R3P38DRAFT_1450128 [Favolaschia claudopus]|uniref:DUF6534 domain-containing protein n=1 Tax=Favolaschia claudopus TaxID=2862362 RepID=A0AAW0AME7_9AGAR
MAAHQSITALTIPLLLAGLLHWALFGALTVQLYFYYQAFPNDRAHVKSVVYTMYILEIIQTALITHDPVAYLGLAYDNSAVWAETVPIGWYTVPILSSIGSLIGQFFYAHRLYMLSNSYIIPVIIVLMSVVSSTGGFLDGKYLFEGQSRLDPSAQFSGLWLAGSALTDILIAVSMIYYLSKPSYELRKTRVLVSKVIRLIIETGFVTAVVTLITIGLFYGFPEDEFYFVSAQLIPNLYANTMFAVLNSRLQIVGGRSQTDATEFIMSLPQFARSSGINVDMPMNTNTYTVERVEIGCPKTKDAQVCLMLV